MSSANSDGRPLFDFPRDETHRRADDRRHGEFDHPHAAGDSGDLCPVARAGGEVTIMVELIRTTAENRRLVTALRQIVKG